MTLTDTHQPRLRHGVLHLLSGSLLGRAFGFLLNLLLSRILGPARLGLFSLVLSTAQTFELTARFGVDYGLSCALTGPEADTSRAQLASTAFAALRLVQLLTGVLALALWLWITVFGGLLPAILPMDRGGATTALILIASLEALACLPWELFLITGQTRLVSLRQGLFAPAKLLGACLGGSAAGIGGALMGYAIVSAIQTIWLLRHCHTLFPWPRRWQPHWGRAWQLVRLGAPLFGSNALASLVFLPLLADVARSAGIADVGYLRVGQIIVQLFTLLPGAFAPLLFLRLRRIGQQEQAGRDSELSLRWIWWLGLTSLLLYLLVDKPLVRLFFGPRFLPSLQPTRLLVLAAVLDSVNQILHTPLLANRRTRLYAIGQNIPALLAAAAGWWLIPRMGVQGFLLAKLLFAAGPVVIYLFEGWQRYGHRLSFGLFVLATAALLPLCWQPALNGWLAASLLVPVIGFLAHEGWSLRGAVLAAIGSGGKTSQPAR